MTFRKPILLLIVLAAPFLLPAQIVINAVSPPTGAFNLAAGGCFTEAVTVSGAGIGMTVTASPRTFPGNGVTWEAYVSAANTVTVKVCSIIAAFVGSSVYDINLLTGSNTAAPPFVSAFNSGTGDAICALGGDTSISGIACQPGSATTATAFSTTVTIPANTLNTNAVLFDIALGAVSPASPPNATLSIKLGSTVVYTGLAATISAGTLGAQTGLLSCRMIAPAASGATAPVIVACSSSPRGNTFSAGNFLLTNTAPTVAVATNVSQILSVTILYSAATAGNAVWLQSITHL
jgi:hypothetical protein